MVALLAHKDASIVNVMDLLRLDSPLADIPGMTDLQPDPEQLFVPIHQPEDNVVMGAESLSYALEKCHQKVIKIRESIAATEAMLSCLCDPLVEPLSVQAFYRCDDPFGW